MFLSRPSNLELGHPFCASNPVERWPGPDARDSIHYLSGWHFERRFRRWIDGFEWTITRGQPVPRNQFGSHPWFSVSNPRPQKA